MTLSEPIGESLAPVELAAVPDAPPKMTIENILDELLYMERLMDREDFDPASIIGEISLNSELLKKKIDSIDYVIQEFEAYAARTRANADNKIRRATTALKRAASLQNYVFYQMKEKQFEKLTGNERYVYIKKNPPSLVVKRGATEQDMLDYGEQFVSVIPRSYEWKNKELKKALLEKTIVSDDLAEIKCKEVLVFDDVDAPDVSGPKKKVKK